MHCPSIPALYPSLGGDMFFPHALAGFHWMYLYFSQQEEEEKIPTV